jgi:hypothetical protein
MCPDHAIVVSRAGLFGYRSDVVANARASPCALRAS